MAFTVTDLAHVKETAIADATYMRDQMNWTATRYNAYSSALTTDSMTAMGFTSDEQATINGFVANLERCMNLCAGGLPPDATDMMVGITQILGLD